MHKPSYLSICKELVHADLLIFKQTFIDKFIDVTIWVTLSLLVTAYVLPYFGLAANFGVFQLGGMIAAAGLFELYGNVVDLISDFQGDRTIDYGLTLPIPSWMAIVSKAVYYYIIYVIISALMFPIGKLCLWNQLDLTQVSYFKLVLAILFQSMFFATFVLFTASLVKNMAQIGVVWARFIFPMWFMGGFQFSWIALHKMLPSVAYFILLNPMMYITEAVRVALLGQEDFINFWLCLVAITGFSALFLYLALRNLKKKLDYV